MKKLIAAALAIWMLLAPMALGDTGDRVTCSDMALEMTEDGDTRAVDLSGFMLALTAGSLDGVPTMQAELYRKGSRTHRTVMQVIHGVAYFNMDYMTQPVALNLAAVGPSAQSFVEGLFENASGLMDLRLPPFEGVTIPRLKLTPLASAFGAAVNETESGARTASFEIPRETVDQLLERVRRYGEAAPEAARGYFDSAFRLIDALTQGDSGFAVKGTAEDGKKKSTLTMDIFPVRDGVTADEPAATVTASFAKNKVTAAVEMRQAGFSMNVAAFSLTSKTKKARLECALNVMGMLDAAVKIHPVDGAQFASAEATVLGKRYRAALTYGPRDGGDFVDLELALADRLGLSASVDARVDEAGVSVGTFVVNATRGDGGARYALNGEIAGNFVDADFYPVKDPGNAIDLLNMTDGQRAQLSRDFRNIAGIVSRYFNRVAK